MRNKEAREKWRGPGRGKEEPTATRGPQLGNQGGANTKMEAENIISWKVEKEII